MAAVDVTLRVRPTTILPAPKRVSPDPPAELQERPPENRDAGL